MKVNKKLKDKKGFTLVELLVVIAIIGILAIVAVPALFKNINKAKIADVESDYNAVKSSIVAYYADNNKFTSDLRELNIEGFNENKSAIGGEYKIRKKEQQKNGDYIMQDAAGNRNTAYKIDSNGKIGERVNLDNYGDVFLTIQGLGENILHINQTQFEKLVDDIGHENMYISSKPTGVGYQTSEIYIRLANNILPKSPQ